ncbi:Fic family protein [Pseudomonas sp. ENNP23]|uniref:Fic family protein n=1 Tax=Pseudomonas sp. ENNP23 TaxID=1535636 RepID=UPI0009F225A5|nr:Fic family protein [Pseudomonas sp. ENNP23]
MIELEKTPYTLDQAASIEIINKIKKIEERVSLLRKSKTLTEETIKDYYGEKRFEQVAESNAIEGSTLSAGETELAVLKGITITGHDPAYIRDALALDKALNRAYELSKQKETPTDIEQIHEIHFLLLGERRGAGIFRNEPILISRASHRPPKTWNEIINHMEEWRDWSVKHQETAAPIRAVVLHAWLAHVHPYTDGNGRTARALGNLELIRAGYPPIIIKKKERERYIEALAESDEGGDISSFFELVLEKINGALTGLELSAKKQQGFDPVLERLKQKQSELLQVWENGVKLLVAMINLNLSRTLEKIDGKCSIRTYDTPLDLEDFHEICKGNSVSKSWTFSIKIEAPGLKSIEKLAYIAPRSQAIFSENKEHGPSLYWSHSNPNGHPKWISDGENSPYAVEITAKLGEGDTWRVRKRNNLLETITTKRLAEKIAEELLKRLSE